MFLLVEFTDQKELAVIPDNWQDGTRCALWPPFKSSSKVVKAVINKAPPLHSWKAYPIRVLYTSGKCKTLTFNFHDVFINPTQT